MPGGCCLLGVCCPPAQRQSALAAKVLECLNKPGTNQEKATDVAKVIFEDYDLVPKGVGAAIVEGYKDAFAEEPPA